MQKYHIFNVYNYKGGSQGISANMYKDQFIEELIENYISFEDLRFNKKNPDVKQIADHIKNNIKQLSEYAGDSSLVATFCVTEIKSSFLTFIDLDEFINENIVEVLKQFLLEYDYKLTQDDVNLITL